MLFLIIHTTESVILSLCRNLCLEQAHMHVRKQGKHIMYTTFSRVLK